MGSIDSGGKQERLAMQTIQIYTQAPFWAMDCPTNVNHLNPLNGY